MFMAPEQAVGDRSLDARADIYALGRDDVLRAHGPAAVLGRERLRRDDGPRPRPRRAPIADPPRRARGSRARDPPLPGQEARRALPDRQGPGRGPGRLRRGFRLGRQSRRCLVGFAKGWPPWAIRRASLRARSRLSTPERTRTNIGSCPRLTQTRVLSTGSVSLPSAGSHIPPQGDSRCSVSCEWPWAWS